MLVVAELGEVDDLLLFRVGELLHFWGHVGMGNAITVLNVMISLSQAPFFFDNQHSRL